MVVILLFSLLASAALPKHDTYYLSNDSYLTISRASESSFSFELEGGNSYSGNSSELRGEALREGAGWEFLDKDDPGCRVTFRPLSPTEIDVGLTNCHGQWIDGGIYKAREQNCGSSFDIRSKEIGELSKQKRFSAALNRAQTLADDCLESLDENEKGALHSDLAFLALKTGNIKRCRKEIGMGIQALGSPKSKQELQQAWKGYAEKDEKGHLTCKNATKPGCFVYEERIRIYRRLEHNQKLCR